MTAGPRLRARTAVALALVLVPLLGASPAEAGMLSLFSCACPWLWGGAGLVGGWLLLGPPLDITQTPPVCATDGTPLSATLVPSASVLHPKDSFDVAIFGDITQPVISYGFHMAYDSSLLNLDGLTVAPQFTSGYSPRPDGLVATAYPNPAIGEHVLLGTARFTARLPGIANIGIELTAGDPLEGFAQQTCGFADLNVTPTSVTVVQPPDRPLPPAPEPATILLLVGGLGLMWRPARRLRRRA